MIVSPLTGLLLLVSVVAIAQDAENANPPGRYEIGLGLGRNQYFGDLHSNRLYASSGANMSLQGFIRRRISSNVSVRGNFLLGKMSASDLDEPNHRWDYRRLKFTTPVAELSAMLEVYPLGRQAEANAHHRWLPYGLVGVGSAYTNPIVTQLPGATAPPSPEKLAADRASLVKTAAVFPVGLGVTYAINPKLSAGLELSYRFSTSDYLDGFRQAGYEYSRHRDSYLVAHIQVAYKIRPPGNTSILGNPDDDNDGVPDADDNCPDEFGDAATCGCPDDDHDGVPNACDCCPTEPGERAYHGCAKAHTIEYEHVRMPNSLRYCPFCPPNLPTVWHRKGLKYRNAPDAVGASR